ncbi:Rne/Rng family ribonuclease [Paenibacillus hamazuiensis]|uniref:Rne/Rng family ribonuclease n=1 Tax=Paenibacillus hamazuiensis TaxID=2936508 RepID=UPI00200D0A3D|nr:Rne/Rng family ribonuclease [Paenibacillus hamazuiensis]
MKLIAVHCEEGSTRVALMEDGKLQEYYEEGQKDHHIAGNIYIGKVVNVLPGMQAAFVDIGLKKNAFLYIDDVLPAHLEKQPKVKPPISDLVSEGQELMVQVIKEPVGTKGARITTHYAIPGRWGVYMPYADYIGISRKIDSEAERERLKGLTAKLLKPGEGFIVRTMAEGESEEAIAEDLRLLRSVWRTIEKERTSATGTPRRIYSEMRLIPRLVRDLVNHEVDELVIDHPQARLEIESMLKSVSPEYANKVRAHKGQTPLFRELGIEDQLEKAFHRKVWLDNGAYVIVDRTEALTVFDVNTGKYTGSVDLGQTVFEVNMAAAEEISRLLRLRDIGGLIIIDFIDMDHETQRQAVVQSLEAHARRDRTKTVIVGWTKLGLVELTRKKVRESREQLGLVDCPICQGSGKVRPT